MKRAFTFTELVVLAAIVIILAAVLYPVLSSQPRSIAACINNENQLIAGARLYSADYDNHVLPYLSCSALQCPGYVRFDVDRVWTRRMRPYVASPLDPETGEPYFPPTAPYRCPDWNLTKLEQGADAADCDGDGTPGSGLGSLLPYKVGPHMRSELFSTYGVAFGMCSPQESASGMPQCLRNGGGVPDSLDYAHDGSTSDLAIFSFAGDSLYPVQYKKYLGRTLAQIVRPAETALIGEGGTWQSSPQSSSPDRPITAAACEGAHMHWQHVWGGNIAFADGHSAWIGGNSERVRYVGPDGLWIEKYWTFYE